MQAHNATCNTEILNLNFKRYLNIFFISSQFTSYILLNTLNFVDLSTPLSIKHTNTLTHTHIHLCWRKLLFGWVHRETLDYRMTIGGHQGVYYDDRQTPMDNFFLHVLLRFMEFTDSLISQTIFLTMSWYTWVSNIFWKTIFYLFF